MKNKSVCKGCKYLITQSTSFNLRGTCEYSNKTGQSRLMIERENGGYRKDSCPCYEKGKRTRGRRKINFPKSRYKEVVKESGGEDEKLEKT